MRAGRTGIPGRPACRPAGRAYVEPILEAEADSKVKAVSEREADVTFTAERQAEARERAEEVQRHAVRRPATDHERIIDGVSLAVERPAGIVERTHASEQLADTAVDCASKQPAQQRGLPISWQRALNDADECSADIVSDVEVVENVTDKRQSRCGEIQERIIYSCEQTAQVAEESVAIGDTDVEAGLEGHLGIEEVIVVDDNDRLRRSRAESPEH